MMIATRPTASSLRRYFKVSSCSKTQWHRSLGYRKRFPLVYVEYLASAPWNRRLLEDPPYLIGVGRALVLFARQRSVELGYGGRVGLHALPGAEAFYRRYSMPDYGSDPDKEGLVYFEYAALNDLTHPIAYE